MPVYTEKVKDKKTGKMVDKKVDGQKVYYVRTYVTDEFGNKKQVTRHNKTWLGLAGKDEASREEIRLRNSEIVLGKKKEAEEIPKKITFKELTYLKLEYDQLHNNNSESTRMTYIERLHFHVFSIIGDKNIYDLNKKDFDKIINHLLNFKIKKGINKGKNLGYKYINEIIHQTKTILKYGIEFYKLDEELLKYLKDIKQDKDKVKKSDYLELLNKKTIMSPDEWIKVTNTMEEIIKETKPDKKEMVKRLMIFLTIEYILFTRVGETQAFKFSNIDFKLNIYHLYEQYNKRLKKITPVKNRDERILFIPPNLCKLLYKLYKEDKKDNNFNEEQLIFGKDKVFARSTIDRYRKKLFNKSGINYLTNHKLRHAGLSNAFHENVDISALADMAGHDKEVMMKIYVQTLNKSNSRLVQTLNNINIPEIKFN